MGNGIGGHHSPVMGKDEWITPRHILAALPPFDLDPCRAVCQPWETARRGYTRHEDGLSQQWEGRVWLNPPYGKQAAKWLARLADHGDGIALIFARTDTEMFFEHVFNQASAILFLRGRLTFHHADGRRADHNSGAPSVLVAYGMGSGHTLQSAVLDGSLSGKFVWLNRAGGLG